MRLETTRPKLLGGIAVLLVVASAFVARRADAYIGPGAGLSTSDVGTLLLVLGIGLAVLVALLWYPIKLLLRRLTG